MKEYICQVVPVYLRPQPITDEKACIGVIVRCPETSFAAYRIIDSGSAAVDRIANFFPRFGRENLERALAWSRHDIAFSLSAEGSEEAERKFANLIRPRENVIQYGAPQAFASKSPEADVDRIYRRSVA